MEFQVFQAKAFPISSRLDHDTVTETDSSHTKIEHQTHEKKAEESETSADETEPEDGMTFIRRSNVESTQMSKKNVHGERNLMYGIIIFYYSSDLLLYLRECMKVFGKERSADLSLPIL